MEAGGTAELSRGFPLQQRSAFALLVGKICNIKGENDMKC